jgi:hypothetical protein
MSCPLMRRFVFFLLFGLGAACQKKQPEIKCYECEMTYISGIPAGTQYPCSSTIDQWQKEQKDNNGNPMASVCREK